MVSRKRVRSKNLRVSRIILSDTWWLRERLFKYTLYENIALKEYYPPELLFLWRCCFIKQLILYVYPMDKHKTMTYSRSRMYHEKDLTHREQIFYRADRKQILTEIFKNEILLY